MALVKLNNLSIDEIALDFSDTMIEQAKKRFTQGKYVTIVETVWLFSICHTPERTALHRNIQTVKPPRCLL